MTGLIVKVVFVCLLTLQANIGVTEPETYLDHPHWPQPVKMVALNRVIPLQMVT